MTALDRPVAQGAPRPRSVSPAPSPRALGGVAPRRATTVRLTAVTAAALTGAALATATAVRLAGLAAGTRELLGFRFAGLPARPSVALAILAHNVRAVLAVLALLAIAQIAARRPGGPGRGYRALLLAGEALLAATIAINVLIVGAARGRLRRAHGPGAAAPRPGRAGRLLGRARALPPGPPPTPAPPPHPHRHRPLSRAARRGGRPGDVRVIVGLSPLRLLAVLLAIGAGLAGSALLAAQAEHLLHQPLPAAPATHGALGAPTRRPPARRRRTAPGERRAGDPPPGRIVGLSPRAARPAAATRPLAGETRPGRHDPGGFALGLSGGALAAIVGGELALGLLAVCALLAAFTVRRVRLRARREYRLYEVHLSTHDEAKPQDLQDMLEQIANIVRAFPADRARRGQPFVALELICNRAGEGMEWSLNLRCQPQVVQALDGALSAAYPDVRVGHVHAEAAAPRPGVLREPGHVMRFRKERSFIYPLIAPDDRPGSPPLEQIARAQVALAQPSIVRLALTPTPTWFEALARRHHHRRERGVTDQPRSAAAHRPAPSATLHRAELINALAAQNQSLFWLEAAVAADSPAACQTIAAAVQARRGENRLHRRVMVARQGLYRRRFPRALGPLIPSPRSLVSAAEAAHLLALPSARMKGVPMRRLTVPRIPAPPRSAAAHANPTAPAPRTAPPATSRSRLDRPPPPPRARRGDRCPASSRCGGSVSDAAGGERGGAGAPRRPQVRRAADRWPGRRARARRCSIVPQ